MKLFKSCEDGVHKFEARYDTKYRDYSDLELNWVSISDIKEILNSPKKQTYIYDVCVKCGKTINREDK